MQHFIKQERQAAHEAWQVGPLCVKPGPLRKHLEDDTGHEAPFVLAELLISPLSHGLHAYSTPGIDMFKPSPKTVQMSSSSVPTKAKQLEVHEASIAP